MLLAALLFLSAAATAPQSPDQIWQDLMQGNKVYVSGHEKFDDITHLREHSAAHQNPPVTLLSCSDSRVPAEIVFDKTINSLFVVRVAGNIAGPYEIASIEYAIANGYTKMIVVMGHESCGAVSAALSDKDPGSPSLNALVAKIRESFGGMKRALDPATVRKAVEANTRASAADLLKQSKIISDAVKSGRVALVTAYYDLDAGTVERLK